MIFPFQEKNHVSFSKYLDFCVIDEFITLKICDAIIDTIYIRITISTVLLESKVVLVQLMTNI